MKNSNSLSLVCSSCGAAINVETQQETVTCPYCQTGYRVSDLLGESDAVKAEKIRAETYKEVERDRLQIEREKMRQEAEREKHQSEETERNNFKKSKFSKVLMVFAVICVIACFSAFFKRHIFAGIIALLQSVIFVTAWLIGMQIIKEKKKGIHILAVIAAFLLIIPYCKFYNTSRAEKFQWTDLQLCELLPKPESDVGEVHTDTNTRLWLEVQKISGKQYNDYITACRQIGFSVDDDETSFSYSAFNADGYKLQLSYYNSDSEMDISLDAPMKMIVFEWPSSDIAKLLPIPKSNIGNISRERSDGFVIYVGKTPIDDYNAYVKECAEKGFDVDYKKEEDSYSAINQDGYALSLSYEGANVMRVSIEESKKDEKQTEQPYEPVISTNAPEDTKENSQTASPAGGIRPEFKEAMDSYEAFIDEYAAFMEKYLNSEASLSMLGDYANYMKRYTETMEKMEAVDEGELSVDEALYYTQVQSRITQKLINIAQ